MSTTPPLLQTPRSLDDLLRFDRYVAVGNNSGGDRVRRWMEAHGKEVVAFCDLLPELCGTGRNGLPVLLPSECAERFTDNDTAFVIGTIRQREAAEALIHDLGVAAETVFPYLDPMFAPHYEAGVQARLAPSYARVRRLLADSESREYFDRVVAFFRTLDARHLAPQPRCFDHYGYDAAGANARPGDRIVDCGAFTGDSFDCFLNATGGDCRIYAMEAFLPNLARMLETVAARSLKAKVVPLHVAAAAQRGALVMSGDASIADACAHIGAGSGTQDIVLAETLDALFLEHFKERIDYLKIDIEGADLDALHGTEQLLRAQRPVVAVAAYHRPDHFVAIADFLRDVLAPCRLYAANDPQWMFQLHYLAVPDERG